MTAGAGHRAGVHMLMSACFEGSGKEVRAAAGARHWNADSRRTQGVPIGVA